MGKNDMKVKFSHDWSLFNYLISKKTLKKIEVGSS